jgi:hypothetical protein
MNIGYHELLLGDKGHILARAYERALRISVEKGGIQIQRKRSHKSPDLSRNRSPIKSGQKSTNEDQTPRQG